MKDPRKEAADRIRNQQIDNAHLSSHPPVVSPMQARDVDPALAWIQDTIVANTPAWAHMLAYFSQVRGMRWIKILLPLARRFTDVHVKTETNIKGAGKGFRSGASLQVRTIRIYKRGKMVAERTFAPLLVTKSPYSKIK